MLSLSKHEIAGIALGKKKEDSFKIIADNRKARYSYAIESTLEAGIILMG